MRCHSLASSGAESVRSRQTFLAGRPISWLCPERALFLSSIVLASWKFWRDGRRHGMNPSDGTERADGHDARIRRLAAVKQDRHPQAPQ
jgi:hypothetical protein